MGLDFGFDKVDKKLFESFNGNKDAFNEYLEKHDYAIGENVTNWCGRGNPIERWFQDGFKYYHDYDGYLFRAITPTDLAAAVAEATQWYLNLKLESVEVGRGFKLDTDENMISYKVDGFEYILDDGSIHRVYNEDSVGQVFITADYVDPWDFEKYPYFVKEIMEIMNTFDWENDVLLYYISY